MRLILGLFLVPETRIQTTKLPVVLEQDQGPELVVVVVVILLFSGGPFPNPFNIPDGQP